RNGFRPRPRREPHAGAGAGWRDHGAEPRGRGIDVHAVAARGRRTRRGGPAVARRLASRAGCRLTPFLPAARPPSRPPNQAGSPATMAAAGAAAGADAPFSGASSPPLLSARRKSTGPTVSLTAISASSRP